MWRRNPTVDEFLNFGIEFNRTKLNFLKIDVETGLTFTGLALQTPDSTKKQRNLRSARKAYDTITGLIDRVDLSNDDAQILARKLKRLKSELQDLGEDF